MRYSQSSSGEDILNQIEQAGTWPWQLLGTSVMLRPKPDNTDGPWAALRCAVIRCATAEAAAECGAALTMVDLLEKFHDTIRIDHLVNVALSLALAARILFIDLTAYLAPRPIQYLGAVSEWLRSALFRDLATQKIGPHIAL